MKKLLCLYLSVLLCLSFAAAEDYVPLSTSKLPELPDAPTAPVIVRVQKAEDSVIMTLDPEWPDGATLTAYYTSGDHRVTHVNAQPVDGFTMEAASPAANGWWCGFDLAWTANETELLARYNAAGGLEHVSCFDARGNACWMSPAPGTPSGSSSLPNLQRKPRSPTTPTTPSAWPV